MKKKKKKLVLLRTLQKTGDIQTLLKKNETLLKLVLCHSNTTKNNKHYQIETIQMSNK